MGAFRNMTFLKNEEPLVNEGIFRASFAIRRRVYMRQTLKVGQVGTWTLLRVHSGG